MKVTAEVKAGRRPTDKAGDGVAHPFRSHVVLVPVEDDCGCARKALQYAIPFARMLQAQIVLLTILPTRYMPTYRIDPVSNEWVQNKNLRDEIVPRLAHLAGDIIPEGMPAEIKVEYGTPSAAILKMAKLLEADLIIVSTHCLKGLLHALIGSVASRVARLAPCPVLVVRENEHEFDQRLGSCPVKIDADKEIP